MRITSVLGVLVLGVLLLAAGPVHADEPLPPGLCSTVRPLVNGGYSTVLGAYGELGVRCPWGPWTLQVGGRYTTLEHGTEPFTILSYDTALSPIWHLDVTASTREHLGDYEVDRLPEVTLLWTPVLPPNSFVMPSVFVSEGWLQTVLPIEGQTVRSGGILNLSTRPFRIGSVTISANYQLGDYYYATAQNTSYWEGTFNASAPISPSTSIALSYQHNEGFGATPLVFDFVSYDNFVWGSISETLGPNASLTFATQFNINVPGYTGPTREYTLTYTKVSEGWSIGIGWYVPTNEPFILGNLPQ